MQKFKRFLVEQMNSEEVEGSSVWGTKKVFPDGKKVMLLSVGKKQVVTITWTMQEAVIHVPDMDFNEVSCPECLSKEARRIINEVESYLN